MKRLWVNFNEWWMLLTLGLFVFGMIGTIEWHGFWHWVALVVSVLVLSFLLLQLALSVYYEKIKPS